MYDVAIVGAGVVGSAIARELSRYRVTTLLLDRGSDVGTGATKANSGIVHGGYTAKHGSLKAELCIRGNRMYAALDRELNFGYRRTGSLVLAFSPEEEAVLADLKTNGEKNGVRGLQILKREQVQEKEPTVNSKVRCALFCPETGVTSPYEFCIALAENAIANGVDLVLSAQVHSIAKSGGSFELDTTQGTYRARCAINAAGIHSDSIAAMVGVDDFSIRPRRGQYLLLQRGTGDRVKHVIFQTPTKKGKGVLVTSTYWGNLMLGPNAEDVVDREDLGTALEALQEIVSAAKRSVPDIDVTKAIRSFSGMRAISNGGDFIIAESRVPGFINVAGIDSPGLTSSPAIAQTVKELLQTLGMELKPKADFRPYRRPITSLAPLKPFRQVRDAVELPSGEPRRIVCRCEQVTEQTIVDAIHRGIPVTSTDAIKRRTRAGMGVCQGSFCTKRVQAILERETGLPSEAISLRGPGSGTFPSRVSKEEIRKMDETPQ